MFTPRRIKVVHAIPAGPVSTLGPARPKWRPRDFTNPTALVFDKASNPAPVYSEEHGAKCQQSNYHECGCPGPVQLNDLPPSMRDLFFVGLGQYGAAARAVKIRVVEAQWKRAEPGLGLELKAVLRSEMFAESVRRKLQYDGEGRGCNVKRRRRWAARGLRENVNDVFSRRAPRQSSC